LTLINQYGASVEQNEKTVRRHETEKNKRFRVPSRRPCGSARRRAKWSDAGLVSDRSGERWSRRRSGSNVTMWPIPFGVVS
jgi:hypothetical protein